MPVEPPKKEVPVRSIPPQSEPVAATRVRRAVLLAASLTLGALSARCADNSTVVGRALVSVAVTPAVDTITRIGDTLILTVTVDGQQAGPFEPISWTSLSEGVATVDSLGAVRAVAEGSALIVATVGGLGDTALVVVWPARLTQLVLIPASITLAPAGTTQFAVSGTLNDGSSTVPAVTYSATGGTITASGLYTAGTTPGAFQVIAIQQLIGIQPGGPKADTSSVTIAVSPPTLTQLVLTPASISLAPAETRQFAVSGTWSDGSTTVPAVTYAATGGTITAAGLYTAGVTAGTFHVIATQQGGPLADTATVTITALPPTLTQLTLTPASVTLAPTASRQFAVTGTWSDGSSAVPAVTYSATGGTITPGGLYTAGLTPGTFQVVATHQGGTKADSAVVTVTPAPPTGLAVVTQPGGAVSGIAFVQQPVVEVRNGQNQPVAQAGVLVTAAKATGTGSLVGTLTATTNAQGRASFATLAIVGTGLHTLDFTAVGLTKGTSQGFSVSPPAGFAVNAGTDQTIAFGGAAVMSATITGATPVNAFWTMISGPGKASLASEQFNSTFDDITLTDWIGGHQVEIRTPDGAFPDEVGMQGDMGNWYTTDAPPTTDRPRTGTRSWKAFTPYNSRHSAKLLKWNLDDTEAYFSAWVYWPSGQVVYGHGSGGFINYLNLMQWKERSQPWNPTWVIAVTGLSAGVDQFAIHDWYNNQSIVRTGVPVPTDQWFNLTAYMKEGFGTSGELTVWLNHTLLYHQSGINTLGGGTNTIAHLMWGIGNYSNALVGQGEQSIYFDDVTVTPAADVTRTTATFAAPGTYVLRLTAFDGTSTLSDDVTITVQ